MKKKFINADNINDAKKMAPWANKIVKIESGFIAFEDISDYIIWKNKKPKKKNH